MNFFSDPQMGVFFDPIWDKGEICAEICDGSGSSDTFSVNFFNDPQIGVSFDPPPSKRGFFQ